MAMVVPCPWSPALAVSCVVTALVDGPGSVAARRGPRLGVARWLGPEGRLQKKYATQKS